MNETIKAISGVIGNPCPKQCDHEAAIYGCACAECTHTAELVYTAHVKPLEDALAKAEIDNDVLVEALWEVEATIHSYPEGCTFGDILKIIAAALASVKGDTSNA